MVDFHDEAIGMFSRRYRLLDLVKSKLCAKILTLCYNSYMIHLKTPLKSNKSTDLMKLSTKIAHGFWVVSPFRITVVDMNFRLKISTAKKGRPKNGLTFIMVAL
jgi:hypothetical protein